MVREHKTIRLDDDVQIVLKNVKLETGKSFSQTTNDAIRNQHRMHPRLEKLCDDVAAIRAILDQDHQTKPPVSVERCENAEEGP
jgi:hypothetical protein